MRNRTSEDNLFLLQAVRNVQWIQNNNDEYSNKNETKRKTVSVSSRELKLSSSKVKNVFQMHPYGSCCMKLESLHNLTLPGKCNMIWGLLTFKLGLTSL